jgi:hypothetical protein
MRKLLWMIIFIGGYIWLVTSGHDEFVLNQGKMVYQALVSWFDDAQVDFQIKKDKNKKKSRRWD